METLLLVITVGSLMFALVMCVLVWRMSQEERRRAAARVAQLAAEAASPMPAGATAGAAVSAPPAAARTSPWSPPPVPAVPAAAATAAARIEPPRSEAKIAHIERAVSRAADEPREAKPVEELTLSTGFLGTPNRAPESAGRQRGLAAAAAVLAVGLVVFGLYAVLGPSAQQEASARAAAAATPLELLSLRHERIGGRLSVSGLVKNPSAGQAVERLHAVVFVFDQSGTFVTSGRAPVDFIRIAAGEESPFVVALDAPQNVARYRVSFRTDAGTLPHVDKRGASPVAMPIEPAATIATR